MVGVQFGAFDDLCSTAALVICPLMGTGQGIEPSCYSRNVEVSGTLIFQPGESWSLAFDQPLLMRQCWAATAFVHIVAIIMTAIMIWHIRSKYTAVGK